MADRACLCNKEYLVSLTIIAFFAGGLLLCTCTLTCSNEERRDTKFNMLNLSSSWVLHTCLPVHNAVEQALNLWDDPVGLCRC